MPSNSVDLERIKADLLNIFVSTAEYYDKPKVAASIREILPLLTNDNAERETADGVTELSRKAKEEALVEPEKSLEIVGLFPDWWRSEKSVIKEKAEEGPVRFWPRGYENIPKNLERDIRKAGVKIKPSSGVISLNLSFDSCTFYYTSDAFSSRSDPNRLGIRITGKPARVLKRRLNAIRRELLAEEPPIGRTTEEIYAVRVLKRVCENSSDLSALKEVMRNGRVSLGHRITLLLHCLQVNRDRFYSVLEIAKELQSPLEEVRAEVFSWYYDRRTATFQIFDFHVTEEKEILIKLLPSAKGCWVPGAFLEVLIQAVCASDATAKDLMERYDLPPLGKKKPFGLFWVRK